MTTAAPHDGELAAAEAPPTLNGEVVFEAPWQGRVFGMAQAMTRAALFQWDDFRACLIAELAHHDGTGELRYYDHFLRALEQLLAERGLVSPDALRDRVEAFRHRDHGHDHLHPPSPQK
jgi:nitrile hydratase accessory protein